MSNKDTNVELESESTVSEEVIAQPESESSAEFAEPVAKTEKQIKKKEKHDQHEKEKQKKMALKAKKAKEKADERAENGEASLKDIFGQMFKNKKKKQEPIVQKRVKRVKTDYQTGLTNDQVQERISKGQVNITPNTNNKSVGKIVCENVFTFFNILCFIVAIALVVVNIVYKQKWNNLLFMVIILVNITIGIIQEIKAKRTIEKLSLLTAPVVKVIRDGVESNINSDEIVIDDIIMLSTGKQIVADCVVVEGNIEVNESILTGESLPIKKKVGDTILAGSFVVSGHCHARVEKVGSNCYLQQLAISARKYRKPKSELFSSLKVIIKVIGVIILPITALMFYISYNQPGGTIVDAVTITAGSTIGMIPAGMFLLCSVSLTVSVIKLAKRKALVQDLYCVEMLARSCKRFVFRQNRNNHRRHNESV